jgi:putative nucleotidyltransferase with HDIG domain
MKRKKMKSEIVRLLPEIEQIEDQKVKEQVIATWEDAVARGGWLIKELGEIPFTLLIPECSISIITHTRAVTHTSIEVAKVLLNFYKDQEKINRNILIAGAILHDVGKIVEYAKEKDKIVKSKTGKFLRHPFSGSALAYQHGLPDEVVHIIATHAHEGDGAYRSVEAIIVHYADFINFESLGGKA